MFRPINPDREFAGVNLAESFAVAYANAYGVDVGLIACADGGTSLAEWQEGGVLYQNAVNQARLALRTSSLAGILWHQGEMDCKAELRSRYAAQFTAMIEALKQELNIPEVPVLVGGLGDFLANTDFDENMHDYYLLNVELKKLANKTKRIAFVSAEGLGGKADNLHFHSKALHEFGLRYFSAFQSVRDEKMEYENKDDGCGCYNPITSL